MLKQTLLIILLSICSFDCLALVKKWTGLAGDGLWSSALNWNNNSLPLATDDVVLDNTATAGDYTVTLPNIAVTIKTLSIAPATGSAIRLVLPVTNTVAPALTVTGPGYGIVIGNGGVFRNNSGLTTGASLSITDSIRINNGGRYVHSSRSPSASSIVQYLSKAPGTEKGVFEYDVPYAAMYAVSITNRTYGSLVFSAAATGASRVYTGSGANQLTINGDLEINTGAVVNINLSGTNGNIVIKGNYVQNGGVFNLADGANNTVVKIAGSLQQSASGVITETDAGLPVIELNGSGRQAVSLQGTVSNSVAIRLNNASGALLQSPLSLPYKLDLVNGILSSSASGLLTLQSGCIINADSSSNMAFVDGPLRKEGLSGTPYFLFPVGKQATMQWVELKQATGNFTVEFIQADPHTLSTALDTSIAAISGTGYWSITADPSPLPAAYAGFAYYGPNSAGITDMNTLSVAQLSAGKWISRHNTGTTGSAGAAGSVTSERMDPMAAATSYFTLAAAAIQNSLAIDTAGTAARPVPAAAGTAHFDLQMIQSPPANDTRLLVKAPRNMQLVIVLFNMQGVPLRTWRLPVAAGNTWATINTTALPAGMYVLMAADEKGQRMVRRFVKQ